MSGDDKVQLPGPPMSFTWTRFIHAYLIWCFAFWLFWHLFVFGVPGIATAASFALGLIEDPWKVLVKIWEPLFSWSTITVLPGALIAACFVEPVTRTDQSRAAPRNLIAVIAVAAGFGFASAVLHVRSEEGYDSESFAFFVVLYVVFLAPLLFLSSWFVNRYAMAVTRHVLRYSTLTVNVVSISLVSMLSLYILTYVYFRNLGQIELTRRFQMERWSAWTEVIADSDSKLLYWSFWIPGRIESTILGKHVPPLGPDQLG